MPLISPSLIKEITAPEIPFDFAAPVFEIHINGQQLSIDITRYVYEVEYEESDGIASIGRLRISNPDGMFTSIKAFQPGNEIDIFAGYTEVRPLGRVQIIRPRYNFPETGMPTIELVGYSKDHMMMEHAPVKKKGSGKPSPKPISGGPPVDVTPRGTSRKRRQAAGIGQTTAEPLGDIVARSRGRFGSQSLANDPYINTFNPPSLYEATLQGEAISEPPRFMRANNVSAETIKQLQELSEGASRVFTTEATAIGPPIPLDVEFSTRGLSNFHRRRRELGRLGASGTVDADLDVRSIGRPGAPNLTRDLTQGRHRFDEFFQPQARPQPVAPPAPKKPKGGPKRSSFQDIVKEKAQRYGFDYDVDPYDFGGRTLVQKVGMTDYDFLKALCNLAGYAFWVDYNYNLNKWTIHCKKDENITQDKQYIFYYNRGDASNLLSFHPEMALRNQKTKLVVSYRNADKGTPIEFEISELDADSPDPANVGDPIEEIEGPQQTGAQMRIGFGGFAVETIAGKRFKNAKEAEEWAKQWWRRNRHSFVIGKGTLIGIPGVNARQVHYIEGLSKALDGPYYFARVRHVFGPNGYRIDFTARKVFSNA